MKTMVTNPHLTAVAALGSGEVESVVLEVPKLLAGRMVKELATPGEVVVAALVRRGQALVPSPDTKLEIGDAVHITATVSALPRLEKLIAH